MDKIPFSNTAIGNAYRCALMVVGPMCVMFLLINITDRQLVYQHMTVIVPNHRKSNTSHKEGEGTQQGLKLQKKITNVVTNDNHYTNNNYQECFLGDSSMSRLFNAYKSQLKRTCQRLKSANRCNLDVYLGVQRATHWAKPSPVEGPLAYGLKHPFCNDCSGCNSILYKCGNVMTEYVSVEYARDVEMQTKTSKTTQETVSFYLSQRPRNRCVVNSGLHDIAIKNLTDQQYVEHVKQYLSLLQSGCKTIVWISTTAVRGDKSRPQENHRIQIWNKEVKEMVESSFKSITNLDVFNISNFRSLHIDNVHLTGQTYQRIASLISKPK